MSFNRRRKQENGCHSIFVSSGKSHVCYGLYKTRHRSCSRSCEQISIKSWQTTLGSSEVDLQISEKNFQTLFKFGRGKLVLEGYTDADMAGDLDGRKSTSGYLFTFAGGAVSWQSKLQKCVALSTTEAEYIAVTEAGKELVWIKTFFKELGMQQDEYVVYCDSQSAIDLSKNATYHSRTKHIEVRYHWIRDAIEEKRFKLKKIHTDKNAADMMTKVIPKQKMEFCSMLAGMESC